MRVAVGSFHFHDAFADFQNRNIKSAAAKVINGDRLILLLVQAISKRRRRGLVDDALHVQARDFASLLGSLPLRVVEVGRNGDYRILHLLAKKILGGVLQLAQNHGRNLGGVYSLPCASTAT